MIVTLTFVSRSATDDTNVVVASSLAFRSTSTRVSMTSVWAMEATTLFWQPRLDLGLRKELALRPQPVAKLFCPSDEFIEGVLGNLGNPSVNLTLGSLGSPNLELPSKQR